jgi:Protein of unknown function (DUF3618)
MCAMTGPEHARPEPGPDAGIDSIQADIEQTRHELGQTVEALQARLDVKERTEEKVAETRERVVDKADALRHNAVGDGGGNCSDRRASSGHLDLETAPLITRRDCCEIAISSQNATCRRSRRPDPRRH